MNLTAVKTARSINQDYIVWVDLDKFVAVTPASVMDRRKLQVVYVPGVKAVFTGFHLYLTMDEWEPLKNRLAALAQKGHSLCETEELPDPVASPRHMELQIDMDGVETRRMT